MSNKLEILNKSIPKFVVLALRQNGEIITFGIYRTQAGAGSSISHYIKNAKRWANNLPYLARGIVEFNIYELILDSSNNYDWNHKKHRDVIKELQEQ